MSSNYSKFAETGNLIFEFKYYFFIYFVVTVHDIFIPENTVAKPDFTVATVKFYYYYFFIY